VYNNSASVDFAVLPTDFSIQILRTAPTAVWHFQNFEVEKQSKEPTKATKPELFYTLPY